MAEHFICTTISEELYRVKSSSIYQLFTGVYPQDIGFHMCGSIRICTTPERLEEAKYQMQRHGLQKSPQRLITTEEVAQVHPLLNVDDVLGALYFPGGHLKFVSF